MSAKKTNSSQSVNQNTTQNFTSTPTNPEFVTSGLGQIGDTVQQLGTQDPYSFAAGPDPLQTQAGTEAGNLSSPQGYADAAASLKASAGAGAPDIASYIQRFMNPYTDSVVNSSLANFDQNSAQTNAQSLLNRGQDTTFGGSGAAITDALTRGQQALARGQLESGIRSQGFDTALGGATSQAGADATAAAQRIAAAQAESNNATAMGANDRANIDSQSAIGQILQQLAQTKALAPINTAGSLASIYSTLPLSLLQGQTGTTDGTLTGTSKGTQTGIGGSVGWSSKNGFTIGG